MSSVSRIWRGGGEGGLDDFLEGQAGRAGDSVRRAR